MSDHNQVFGFKFRSRLRQVIAPLQKGDLLPPSDILFETIAQDIEYLSTELDKMRRSFQEAANALRYENVNRDLGVRLKEENER